MVWGGSRWLWFEMEVGGCGLGWRSVAVVWDGGWWLWFGIEVDGYGLGWKFVAVVFAMGVGGCGLG